MLTARRNETLTFPIYSWPDRLGVGFPLTALVWSWILGNSMSLVYLPWAPYAMLALTVWVMVLLTRLCQREDKWNFPGGKPAMALCIACSMIAVLWMALFVVGFGIMEFALFPAGLLVIYTLNQMILGSSGKMLLLTYFIGGLAFAYGCAVPAWYSAAIYSVPLFLVDQRTISLGLLIFVSLTTNELWKRERRLADDFIAVDWEEEDARLMVWVSTPLLLLAGFCLFQAYKSDSSGAWVYYSIAISAGLMHVLNKIRDHCSVMQLRWLMFIALVLPALFQWLV